MEIYLLDSSGTTLIFLSAQWKPFSVQTPKGEENFPIKDLLFPFFLIIYIDPAMLVKGLESCSFAGHSGTE